MADALFPEICPVNETARGFPENRHANPDVSKFSEITTGIVGKPVPNLQSGIVMHQSGRWWSYLGTRHPGELAEQLSAYQEIVTNRAVMELATKSYIDPRSRKQSRRGRKGAGSARRFPTC